MSKSKVGIVVPVYNYGHFLDACLTSIIEQTFTDFQVIVIDNASTDNTEAVATAWCARDDRIRYVRNESNIGPSHSSIKAFRMTNSKYVLFLASDDQLTHTFLEKAVKGLEDNPSCTFAYSLCSRLINEQIEFGQNLFLPHLPTGSHNIINYLAFTNWIYPSFCLIRRSAIDKTKLFKQHTKEVEEEKAMMELQGLGDHSMWIHLSKFGNAFAINERLGIYRIHGDSESSKLREGRRDIVELTYVCDYIFRNDICFNLVTRLLSKVNSIGRLATNFGVVRIALEMAHGDKFREIVEPVRSEFLQSLRQILNDFKYDTSESDPSSKRMLDKNAHIELLDEYLCSGDSSVFQKFK